jgi:cyclohexanone monooxygenase
MSEPEYVDALVVGAGFGGIYATYRLSRMHLTVKCIEMAGDVGGTWYWNRYPGAMSDTESYLYRYSWDKEDLQEYPWTHHYVYQKDILAYLKHVVHRHELEKYMQFNTEMTAAAWDDEIVEGFMSIRELCLPLPD